MFHPNDLRSLSFSLCCVTYNFSWRLKAEKTSFTISLTSLEVNIYLILLTNVSLLTLLILTVCGTTVTFGIRNDFAHGGISVARWQSLRVKFDSSWGLRFVSLFHEKTTGRKILFATFDPFCSQMGASYHEFCPPLFFLQFRHTAFLLMFDS